MEQIVQKFINTDLRNGEEQKQMLDAMDDMSNIDKKKIKLTKYEQYLRNLILMQNQPIVCCDKIKWSSKTNTLSWTGPLSTFDTIINSNQNGIVLKNGQALLYDFTTIKSFYSSKEFPEYVSLLTDDRTTIYSAESFHNNSLYDIRTFDKSFILPSSKLITSSFPFVVCDGSQINWPTDNFYILYSTNIINASSSTSKPFIPLEFQLDTSCSSVRDIKMYLKKLSQCSNNIKDKTGKNTSFLKQIKCGEKILNKIHTIHNTHSSDSENKEYESDGEYNQNTIKWQISNKPILQNIAIAYIIITDKNIKPLLESMVRKRLTFYRSISINPILTNKFVIIDDTKTISLNTLQNMLLLAVNFNGRVKVIPENIMFNTNESNEYNGKTKQLKNIAHKPILVINKNTKHKLLLNIDGEGKTTINKI